MPRFILGRLHGAKEQINMQSVAPVQVPNQEKNPEPNTASVTHRPMCDTEPKPSRGAFAYRRFIKWASMREGPRKGSTRFTLAEQCALLNQLRGGEGKPAISIRTLRRWRSEALHFGLVETHGRACKRRDRRGKPAKRGAYTSAIPSVVYLEEWQEDKRKSGRSRPTLTEEQKPTKETVSVGRSRPNKVDVLVHKNGRSRPRTNRELLVENQKRENQEGVLCESLASTTQEKPPSYPSKALVRKEENLNPDAIAAKLERVLSAGAQKLGFKLDPEERAQRKSKIYFKLKDGWKPETILRGSAMVMKEALGDFDPIREDIVLHALRKNLPEGIRLGGFSEGARFERTIREFVEETADERIDREWRKVASQAW